MIRRAFLRRMASAAMAGMLGLELMSRAPKIEHYGKSIMETLLEDPTVGVEIREYRQMMSVNRRKIHRP